mgnify:CR=1 FL=1
MPERLRSSTTTTPRHQLHTWLKRGLPMALEMKNDEARYYRHRERFNDLLETGGADTAKRRDSSTT